MARPEFFMSSLFIVVPTYHELENLPQFTERLWSSLPQARVLLVDDASGDGTPEWVKTHPRYNKNLFLLERSGKLGLGSAYVAGFAWVQRRIESEPCFAVVQMDADLSHRPDAVPELLHALEAGNDLVLATRYRDGVRVTNWPLHRLLLSLGAAQYVKWITGMPFTDPTGGFKAFRSEKLAQLDLSQIRSDGYAFQIEVTHMAWRLGWKIGEVPITFEDRSRGVSKMSGHIVREAVWRVPWMALRPQREAAQLRPSPERTHP
jgi:dolichol-phosphate mannosyltransferase